MTRQEFYQSTLLWDFDNIWQWMDTDGKQFALLRGLRAQTIPQNENFFNEQITGISLINGDNRINVSVTDSSITADKDCSLSIYTLTSVSIMYGMIRHGSPVSIAGLHPGVYIVQLSDGTSDVTTLKIVKK
ncbi:MAG: T9SS type A sorting domain-containing protein [Bacteroides sp.]|nr:T9SS type A sorting domain-containing protein [Bacteroides sp.]